MAINSNRVGYTPRPQDDKLATQYIGEVTSETRSSLDNFLMHAFGWLYIVIFLAIFLSGAVSILALALGEERDAIFYQICSTIVFVGVVLFFAYQKYTSLKHQKKIKQNDHIINSKRFFEIQDAHLFLQVGLNEFYYAWEQLHAVEMRHGFILIFTDGHQGHYIPVHAFSPEADCIEFYDQLKERWQLANKD